MGNFTFKGLFLILTYLLAIGVGQRKKDAQHDAAKNMFLELKIGMDDYKKFELLAKPAIINDEVEQWAAEGIRASEIRDSPRRCVVEEDDEDSLYPQAGIGNPIADLEEFCHIQRIPAPQYDVCAYLLLMGKWYCADLIHLFFTVDELSASWAFPLPYHDCFL